MKRMSNEELEVRSEELVKQLRHCAALSLVGCNDCHYNSDLNCMAFMLRNAANEIERLNKERRPTPKITGRHIGTFTEAAAACMTKVGMEGCEYEYMADIFDIYELLRCAKKEEAKEEEA